MPGENPSRRILKIEREILRALCAREGAVHARGVPELANYRWRDPEHQVVYEALGKIRGRDADSLREQLAAQATRMGFPDVDWTAYCERMETTSGELTRLLRELQAAVREKR